MVLRSASAAFLPVCLLLGAGFGLRAQDEQKPKDDSTGAKEAKGEVVIEKEVDKTGVFSLGGNQLVSGLAKASSGDPEFANDGDPDTIWRAENGSAINWWEGRLSRRSQIRRVAIVWEIPHGLPYMMEGSLDGYSWEEIGRRNLSSEEGDMTVHSVSAEMQYLRISNPESGWLGGIREIGAFEKIRDLPFHVISEGIAVPESEVENSPDDRRISSNMPATVAFNLIKQPDDGEWEEAFASLAARHSPSIVDRLMLIVRETSSGKRRRLAISTLGELYRDDGGDLWSESPGIQTSFQEWIGHRGVNQRDLFKSILRNRIPVKNMDRAFVVIRETPSLTEIGVDLLDAFGTPPVAVPWLSRMSEDRSVDFGMRLRAATILARQPDGYGLDDAFKFGLTLSSEEMPPESKAEFLEALRTNSAWVNRTDWLCETVKQGGSGEERLAWQVLLEVWKRDDNAAIDDFVEEVTAKPGGEFVALIRAIGERGDRHFDSILELGTGSESSEVNRAAQEAWDKVNRAEENRDVTVGEMTWAERMKWLAGITEPDSGEGAKIFKENCARCHTGKGPVLKELADRFPGDRKLMEAILSPDKEIAEGFPTVAYTMQNGKRFRGFVGSENQEGIIELMDQAANAVLIRKEKVKRKVVLRRSTMPASAAAGLTVEQLANLLTYLRELD